MVWFRLAFVWISAWFRLLVGFGLILDWFDLDFGLILLWILHFRFLLLGFLLILAFLGGSHGSLGGPRTCYEFLGLAAALIMDFLPFVAFPPVTFLGSHPSLPRTSWCFLGLPSTS